MPRPKLRLPKHGPESPPLPPGDEAAPQPGPTLPEGWLKGQLLNVRNMGDAYVITPMGEEFDPHHPERAMRFTNPGECQDFVSRWYMREHHDPRAF